MKLNATTITAAVAVLAVLITLATGIYQLGRLSQQVANLSLQIDQVREENRIQIDQAREENRVQIDRIREENRVQIDQVREENRRDNAALLEELRRSIRQLLDALGNHTHDADGNPVFTIPPGSEPDIENRPQ